MLSSNEKILSALSHRPIKFFGAVHKKLIKDGLMGVPKGYLLLPNKRFIKGRKSDLSDYYLKKYEGYFLSNRRIISNEEKKFGVHFDDIRKTTKLAKEVRKLKNTYAVRVEGDYILEGTNKESKEGNFIRCIRVKGFDNIDLEVQKIVKELEDKYSNSSKIIEVSNVNTKIVNLGECEHVGDFYMSAPMWGGRKNAPML